MRMDEKLHSTLLDFFSLPKTSSPSPGHLLTMLALLALIPLLAAASPIQKRGSGQLIQANRDGLCLSVQGDFKSATSGTPVVSVPCADASLWDIYPGQGSIIMTGTNLALDAGTSPGDFGALKVWQSYPGLYQQTWFLTGDQRIAIFNGNQCLDEGSSGIQTYQCTTGNTNQIFAVLPSLFVPTPPTTGTRYNNQLIYAGRDNLCLTPAVPFSAKSSISDGVPVISADCSTAYTWDISEGSSSVILSGTNFALDAGSYPGNNGGLKVWTSYPGLYQQTWYLTTDNRIAITGGDQCLDEGTNGLQTYQCTTGNTNQIFYHKAGGSSVSASSSSQSTSSTSSRTSSVSSSSTSSHVSSSTSKSASSSITSHASSSTSKSASSSKSSSITSHVSSSTSKPVSSSSSHASSSSSTPHSSSTSHVSSSSHASSTSHASSSSSSHASASSSKSSPVMSSSTKAPASSSSSKSVASSSSSSSTM
ncbi:hypothetical protein BCR39DRAFT_537800 [Naematelia encephala]|uniref:Ricin B lectin domain-containing protein n=1 Tax=Naematelia encephala TaxID=71784 RepID=A0A1Y2B0Q3_9TREE|nr:hypothetical protein BCR39DRAFT_537800 [Naematelia encephala]